MPQANDLTVENEHDRNHPEMNPRREHAERTAGIIDKEGRRVPPAAAFVLVALTFIAVSALTLVILAIVV
jgi:hypothetical protein